jgi:hypothetical protein
MNELTEVHVEIDDAVHAVAVYVHLVPRSTHVQAHILNTGNTYCSQGTHTMTGNNTVHREHILLTGNAYCSQGTHTAHRGTHTVHREHITQTGNTYHRH